MDDLNRQRAKTGRPLNFLNWEDDTALVEAAKLRGVEGRYLRWDSHNELAHHEVLMWCALGHSGGEWNAYKELAKDLGRRCVAVEPFDRGTALYLSAKGAPPVRLDLWAPVGREGWSFDRARSEPTTEKDPLPIWGRGLEGSQLTQVAASSDGTLWLALGETWICFKAGEVPLRDCAPEGADFHGRLTA
jgi:hypothetical protein